VLSRPVCRLFQTQVFTVVMNAADAQSVCDS